MISKLKENTFLDLPSEILIHIIGFLSFDDLFNVINVGNERLEECSIIAMKKKPFSKYLYVGNISNICILTKDIISGTDSNKIYLLPKYLKA